MYRCFCLFVLFVASALIAGPNYGDPDSTQTLTQRVRNSLYVTQMGPPYTFYDTVNLNTDTLWSCPDSLRVCEVRFLKAGTYMLRLFRSGYRPYVADSCDVLRCDLRNLRKVGTDSLCRFGSIRIFGIIE
jgi:hypothetical protein